MPLRNYTLTHSRQQSHVKPKVKQKYKISQICTCDSHNVLKQRNLIKSAWICDDVQRSVEKLELRIYFAVTKSVWDKYYSRRHKIRVGSPTRFRRLWWHHITCSSTVVLLSVTIRYDSVYLTCSKMLTGSQLSPPHGTNKKLKCETKNKTMSMIGPVQSRYHRRQSGR